jgi:hypothetical protein
VAQVQQSVVVDVIERVGTLQVSGPVMMSYMTIGVAVAIAIAVLVDDPSRHEVAVDL